MMVSKIILALRWCVLLIAVLALLMLPIMFFYIQHQERYLSLLEKKGIKKEVVIIDKKLNKNYLFDNYIITVSYSENGKDYQQIIERFIHQKIYNTLVILSKIEIIYPENNQQDAILTLSINKKNRHVTEKSTLNYILLGIGFIFLIIYKITGRNDDAFANS